MRDCNALEHKLCQRKTSAYILFLLTSIQSFLILQSLAQSTPVVPVILKNVDCYQPVLIDGVVAEDLLPYLHDSIYFLLIQTPHRWKALRIHSPHKHIQTSAPKVLRAGLHQIITTIMGIRALCRMVITSGSSFLKSSHIFLPKSSACA